MADKRVCKNCGTCPTCGHRLGYQFVPYYPPPIYIQPDWTWRPEWAPRWTITSGSSTNVTSSNNLFTC